MDEKLTRGALWNKAGTAGIALGAVSAIYLFVTQYLSSLGSSIWISGFSLVLWGIKLLACIWLMSMFMKWFVEKYPSATSTDSFKFGMVTALCSALVYSAITLANVLVINPDLIS